MTATESGDGTGSSRARPVRLTSTLEPQTYRQLTTFCAEAADAIAVTRVPHATVVRALISRLATDSALRSAITDDVAEALRTD
ncbi:hypothetical protein [uncultured Brachybacterium sp.]|uniref:hypothetical protein n=1 Tax=uncultured Brachybacterium sp. TaxID=189680 RepID=UPI00261BB2A0|nr:hypothetical protein [uncultured Brachybacterium sp.]